MQAMMNQTRYSLRQRSETSSSYIPLTVVEFPLYKSKWCCECTTGPPIEPNDNIVECKLCESIWSCQSCLGIDSLSDLDEAINITNVDFNGCQASGAPNIVNEPDDTRFRGGAIYTAGESTLIIKDSTFCNGYATESGGAIFAAYKTTSVSIDNTVFYNNIADGDNEEGGGALYLHETDVYISDSTFASNQGMNASV